MVAYPGVIHAGDRYVMWYSGNGYGDAGLGLATATAPRGKILYRIGASRRPDDSWSAWKPIPPGQREPERIGNIQFAVVVQRK